MPVVAFVAIPEEDGAQLGTCHTQLGGEYAKEIPHRHWLPSTDVEFDYLEAGEAGQVLQEFHALK